MEDSDSSLTPPPESLKSEEASERESAGAAENDTDLEKRYAPIFLRFSRKKRKRPYVPEPFAEAPLEDKDTYLKRPWQERSFSIAYILYFRLHFRELFPSVPEMGPQDLEEGLEADTPASDVEDLMCGLLSLLLNRTKAVENPLAGNKTFKQLKTADRLRLLHCLVDWTLFSSHTVRDLIDEAYRNRMTKRVGACPFDVLPLGQDDAKRAYYYLQGKETRFRVYCETNLNEPEQRWFSVASNLIEMRKLADDLSCQARTVRCRDLLTRIVGDLIPGVEQSITKQEKALAAKQRAETNRLRLADISASYANQPRTRGRRVDYHSMLEGYDNEDTELNDYDDRIMNGVKPEISTHGLSSQNGHEFGFSEPSIRFEDGEIGCQALSPQNFALIEAATTTDSNVNVEKAHGNDTMTDSACTHQPSLLVILKYRKAPEPANRPVLSAQKLPVQR